MNLYLSISQLNALIAAASEILSGPANGWKQPEVKALTNAIRKLRDAHGDWIAGEGRTNRTRKQRQEAKP